MRLYTITNVSRKKGQRWSRTLLIKMEPESIPDYGELERWIVHNFKEWYCLIARMSMAICIAGRPYPKIAQMDHYELRCHAADARMFLALWTIPKTEARQARSRLQELNNRRQGWIKIGDKNIPISDLIAAYKATKSKVAHAS